MKVRFVLENSPGSEQVMDFHTLGRDVDPNTGELSDDMYHALHTWVLDRINFHWEPVQEKGHEV